MPTYLLTWNPRKWPWVDLEKDLEELQQNGILLGTWSSGNTKRILPGDRVFLLRQGVEPRGLVASGWALSSPYSERHWGDEGPLAREALYIDVEWDALGAVPIVLRPELNEEPFVGVNWNTQVSGITVEPEIARALEQEWGRRVGSYFEPIPEEILDADYPEGGQHIVAVNAYERNAAARAACIAHYGVECNLCGFDFAQAYGKEAAGIIHVHHLVPVAKVRKHYSINPIADLRPVCPNCHAVLHRREPPYTLDEMRALLDIANPAGRGWSRPVSELDFDFNGGRRSSLRRDPVERSEEYRRAEPLAAERARDAVRQQGIDPDGFGSCHMMWREKKRILLEEFWIRWRTPSEMNPSVIFD